MLMRCSHPSFLLHRSQACDCACRDMILLPYLLRVSRVAPTIRTTDDNQ